MESCHLGGPEDLVDEFVRRRAESDLAVADASCWGIPRERMSQAKEIENGGPLPARSEAEVRGIEATLRNRPEDDKKVERANFMAD